MNKTEKSYAKKISTIYDRAVKLNNSGKYKAVYHWAGNLYATNEYAVYMVKGIPMDFEFKSKVVDDNSLENMIRPMLHYNTEFSPPTIEELKAYIKEHGYSRAKREIFKAIYKLENEVYINAFYLLDALELCGEDAKGYWSGEISYIGENKKYYISKGAIEVASTDGNNAAWIMPIKALRSE